MSAFVTYLGMGIMILGVLLAMIGWSSGVNFKSIGLGVILMIAGAMIGIGINPARDMPNGSMGMVAIGLVLVAVVGFLFCIESKKHAVEFQEIVQKKKERIGESPLDRFFCECVLSGCDDFSKEKNVARAKLLADKYKVQYPEGIEKLYQQGLEEHKKVSRRFELNRLEDRRAEERKQFDELNRYADLTGKDKRITMLSNRAAELRKKASDQNMYADMLMRGTQQEEMDWATWGGFADGIAGFGAGVSTAIDMQMQNAKIREENEIRRQAAMPAYWNITSSATSNNKNADAIQKEIEEFKMKLISNDSKEDLLKKITFKNTDVLVSETGAAMVCTTASVDKDFKIFEDVPSVIDGTSVAKIYDGDRRVGTAQLVLPVYGLGQNITLRGICIDCCKPGKEYNVKFTARTLCALER